MKEPETTSTLILGVSNIDNPGADLLFQPAVACSEVVSIPIFTNRSSREWTTPFSRTTPGNGVDRPADASRGDDRDSRRRLPDETERLRLDRCVTKAQYVKVRIGPLIQSALHLA